MRIECYSNAVYWTRDLKIRVSFISFTSLYFCCFRLSFSLMMMLFLFFFSFSCWLIKRNAWPWALQPVLFCCFNALQRPHDKISFVFASIYTYKNLYIYIGIVSVLKGYATVARATWSKQLCDACILAQSFINLVSKSPLLLRRHWQRPRRQQQQPSSSPRDKSTVCIPSQDQQNTRSSNCRTQSSNSFLPTHLSPSHSLSPSLSHSLS